MTPQFPAAGKWQFATQFDILGAATRQLIESTEQVIALNIDTSRTAFERSANAVRQLLAMKDPRDLLVLGGQSEEQFQQMLAYTRELFTIATEAQAKLARQAGAAAAAVAPGVATPGVATPDVATPRAATPDAGTPAAPQQAAAAEPAAPQETAAARAEGEPAARRAKPGKKPVVEAGTQAAPEDAKTKPIASAASKVAPPAAGERHPLAAPVATTGTVELPPVKPVEAAPPPAPVSGTPEIDAKQAQLAAVKGARKK